MSLGAWLELIASGLITGGIYALVALGLNLQYGLMRILNIAHGEFLMLGAYVTWVAQTSLGLSPLVMMPLSLRAADGARPRDPLAVLPAADGDLAQPRHLRGARADGCFGLMFLVQNFASWVWGGDLRGYDYLTEPVQFGGAQFAPTSCWCSRSRWCSPAR